ncbi:MAG: hypothetical protein BJ554DRAFT_6238, partial [Olpidium bornovanus]
MARRPDGGGKRLFVVVFVRALRRVQSSPPGRAIRWARRSEVVTSATEAHWYKVGTGDMGATGSASVITGQSVEEHFNGLFEERRLRCGVKATGASTIGSTTSTSNLRYTARPLPLAGNAHPRRAASVLLQSLRDTWSKQKQRKKIQLAVTRAELTGSDHHGAFTTVSVVQVVKRISPLNQLNPWSGASQKRLEFRTGNPYAQDKHMDHSSKRRGPGVMSPRACAQRISPKGESRGANRSAPLVSFTPYIPA